MIRLLAEYRIKKGTLEAVEDTVKDFLSAVRESEPETVYEAFQVGDSDRFIHLMTFIDEAAQERHQEAKYTSDFVGLLYPNCAVMPAFTPLKVIE